MAWWDRLRGRAPQGNRGRPGPWALLASWGPCGFIPIAPGTFGTLGAIPLWWALAGLPPHLYAITVCAFIALAAYAADRAGAHWGLADASPIVIDEVAGFLVTMALAPRSWLHLALGFFAFRLFDVLKPWPASWFDRQKHGLGVVLDDVAAGGYAALALALAERFGGLSR
jgi:phosphatidylglycerophosphatase A